MKKILTMMAMLFAASIAYAAPFAIDGVELAEGESLHVVTNDNARVEVRGVRKNFCLAVAKGVTGVTIIFTDVDIDNVRDGVPPVALLDGAEAELVLKGENALYGADGFAGVFVHENSALTIREDVAGGSLVVCGGAEAAGIGGNEGRGCGRIEIFGGIVEAWGGFDAAGIGGGAMDEDGFGGDGGDVVIRGGTICAYGSMGGAGIGGGFFGDGGSVSILGGSVLAEGEAPWGVDIGKGYGGVVDARITGISGAAAMPVDYAFNDARGNVEREVVVWVGEESYEWLGFGGVARFYLPVGRHNAMVDGFYYRVDVPGGEWSPQPVGVSVNGIDVSVGSGEGWRFERRVLHVNGGGCVISGANSYIAVEVSGDVTISNLVIDASAIRHSERSVFAVQTGATARVELQGVNRFIGGDGFAGLRVPESSTLELLGAGRLCATGGVGAAGIGGGKDEGSGKVVITSGNVEAVRGEQSGGGAPITKPIGKGDGEGVSVDDVLTNGDACGNKAFYPVIFPSYTNALVEIVVTNAARYVYSVNVGSEPAHLYLPEGEYETAIDGCRCLAVVTGGVETAEFVIIQPDPPLSEVAAKIFNQTGVWIHSLSGDESVGFEWNEPERVITFTNDLPYRLTGTAGDFKIVVLEYVSANITIDNLEFNANGSLRGAILVENRAELNLTIKGVNNINGWSNTAGIFVPRYASLNVTAESDGILNVSGGNYGAGIGTTLGDGRCGSVTINSGTIKAAGGYGSAGIGGGFQCNGGNVKILGGSVKARGGGGGKEIGDGSLATSYGTLTNGESFGNKSLHLVKWRKEWGTNVTISVTNGVPYNYVYNGLGHDNDEFLYFYLPNGKYVVESNGVHCEAEVNDADTEFVADEYTMKMLEIEQSTGMRFIPQGHRQENFQFSQTFPTPEVQQVVNIINIITDLPYIITGRSRRYVLYITTSGMEANLTISNLEMTVTSPYEPQISIVGNNVLNLTIQGVNNLSCGGANPAIYVRPNALLNVTEESNGILNVTGGTPCPAIGSNLVDECGKIIINGGTIFANGGDGAAGIGGTGGVVQIRGGSVKAIGGGVGSQGIWQGSESSDSGSLTNGEDGGNENVYLVKWRKEWGTNVTISVTNGVPYEYVYNGPGHDGDDYLYFYLPDGDYYVWLGNDCYAAHVSGGDAEFEHNDLTRKIYDLKVKTGLTVEPIGHEEWGIQLSESDREIIVVDSWPYRISGQSDGYRIVVKGTTDAYLTISNLVMDSSSSMPSLVLSLGKLGKISVRDMAKLNLTIKGDNEILGDDFEAGIFVAPNASLNVTAESDGYLNVYGGKNSAGIGTRYLMGRCGQVTINAGEIVAHGGTDSAGIGGGVGCGGGDVVILGGNVLAFGDLQNGAQDIGHGKSSSSSGTITNGDKGGNENVHLVKWRSEWGTNVTIAVTNSVPYEYVCNGLGHTGEWLNFYLPDGRYEVIHDGKFYVAEVNGDASEFVESDYISKTTEAFEKSGLTLESLDWVEVAFEIDDDRGVITFTNDRPYRVSGEAVGYRIEVADGVSANLAFSNLVVRAENGSAVTLGTGAALSVCVEGSNVVEGAAAGIRVPYDAWLDVHGDGVLEAVGGDGAAAIGGDRLCNGGMVTIDGAWVIARGGSGASGIGGGEEGHGGWVELSNAFIEVFGGEGAAAIGGGRGGEGGIVKIWETRIRGDGFELIGKGEGAMGSGKVTNGEARGDLDVWPVAFWTEGDWKIYLPEGDYEEYRDERLFTVSVGAGKENRLMRLGRRSGLLIDDRRPELLDFEGIEYDDEVVRIVGDGNYELCGTSLGVTVEVASGVTAELAISNLVIDASALARSALVVETGATLKLTATGMNYFCSAGRNAGIAVKRGGRLEITSGSSGSLRAVGGVNGGAGIGGSRDESFGDIVILSGDVWGVAGNEYACDVGGGEDCGAYGSVSNGDVGGNEEVWRVRLPKAFGACAISVTNDTETARHRYTYQCGDSEEDGDDRFIYLPQGVYEVEADEKLYRVEVSVDEDVRRINVADFVFVEVDEDDSEDGGGEDDVSAALTVNGVDVAVGCGEGWRVEDDVIMLGGGGEICLVGSLDFGVLGYRVVVTSAVQRVVASNLTLTATSGAAFEVGVGLSVELLALGTNSFTGADFYAGVGVATNAATGTRGALRITVGENGCLLARGGRNASGIGGGMYEGCGRVEILLEEGSCLESYGGKSGAGIGGGYMGNGGSVSVPAAGVKCVGDKANGAENIGHGAGVANSGTLSSGEREVLEVVYPYAAQVMFIKNGEVFRATGAKHTGDDNLYFYLPKSGGARMRLMAATADRALVVEGGGEMGERIYRVDVGKGVIGAGDREDVTHEMARIAGIMVNGDGALELDCRIGYELPLEIVKVAYGETLGELKMKPECIAPEVKKTDGEKAVLGVPMRPGAKSGFMKLGFK